MIVLENSIRFLGRRNFKCLVFSYVVSCFFVTFVYENICEFRPARTLTSLVSKNKKIIVFVSFRLLTVMSFLKDNELFFYCIYQSSLSLSISFSIPSLSQFLLELSNRVTSNQTVCFLLHFFQFPFSICIDVRYIIFTPISMDFQVNVLKYFNAKMFNALDVEHPNEFCSLFKIFTWELNVYKKTSRSQSS